ncbi:urease accessory protein UreE [Gymnodinialimonas ulvae]|uniref:urease accessory protein UreE n=1 Tax=Gymnodinialimonas ulvae TaxID=3126504 RepID=UPI00309F809B
MSATHEPTAEFGTVSAVRRAGDWSGAAADRIALDYEGRFVRRKRLLTESGRAVLLDLAQVHSLEHGDGLVLADGRVIEIVAAPEPLLKITGDLARLAWHIGNRHTPCQVMGDHLLIRDDHVLKAMLEQLGAGVAALTAPFRPEGGAYGHGRTMGHDHGPGGHVAHVDHSHLNSHGHDHGETYSEMNEQPEQQQGKAG